MNDTQAAFNTAFDALVDAGSHEDAAAALEALRDATEGPHGLIFALFDAFEDDDRDRLRAVADAATTDAARAARLLFEDA